MNQIYPNWKNELDSDCSSKIYQYDGDIDFAIVNEEKMEVVLLDFKASQNVDMFEKYYFQLLLYSIAYEERGYKILKFLIYNPLYGTIFETTQTDFMKKEIL